MTNKKRRPLLICPPKHLAAGHQMSSGARRALPGPSPALPRKRPQNGRKREMDVCRLRGQRNPLRLGRPASPPQAPYIQPGVRTAPRGQERPQNGYKEEQNGISAGGGGSEEVLQSAGGSVKHPQASAAQRGVPRHCKPGGVLPRNVSSEWQPQTSIAKQVSPSQT